LGQQSGELPCEIACVISNHETLKGATEAYGVPFIHIPVGKENKAAAEREQLNQLKLYRVDLVVMARYMQILSSDFLEKFSKPVINIHHSFLPAFAGSRPYHQAHHRGVKLIGATAHYATAVLDDGPIIQQDVARVSHRHTVHDLVVRGRRLERHVLAQAVRWHLENRVLVYGRKTVVFD
jgi:formyltetrahydrofolate deformylase